MRQVLSTAFATVLLLFVGCKKTDISAEADKPLSEQSARMNSILSTTQDCDIIDFESAAAGTLLSSITSQDGVVIPMTSFNSSDNRPGPNNTVDAIVFDSDIPNPVGEEDRDLGTPAAPAGPGLADDGGMGQESNKVALHNIVVIQNFLDYGVSRPNDDDNRDEIPEYITFDFSSLGTVTAKSITVIDVEVDEEEESGWVILYDVNGMEIKKISLPETYENGVAVINLGNTVGVESIKLEINGSIGFDNLEFCRQITQTCTYTQGYWKTHGPEAKGNNRNEWDVTTMMLGTRTYTDAQLQTIFNTPVKGNGLISLAHQLIAAKLNIANGSDPITIVGVIAQADALIGSLWIPPVGSGSLSTNSVSNLVNLLTQYNEGTLPNGPSHCN